MFLPAGILLYLCQQEGEITLLPASGSYEEGTAIVISPLIALMKNQVDAMRNFSTEDDVAHFLNSSLTKTEIKGKKDVIDQGRQSFFMLLRNHLQKKRILIF
jgi:ATP-dependent DNA helicase RecQ